MIKAGKVAGTDKWVGVNITTEIPPWHIRGGLGPAVSQATEALNRTYKYHITLVVPYCASMNKDFERKGEPVVVLRDPSSDDTLDVEVWGTRSGHNGTEIIALRSAYFDAFTEGNSASGGGLPGAPIQLKDMNRPLGYCKQAPTSLHALLAFNQAAADFSVRWLQRPRPAGFEESSVVVMVNDWLTGGVLSALHAKHPAFFHVTNKVYTIHNFFEARCTRAMAGALLGHPPGYRKPRESDTTEEDGTEFSPQEEGVHFSNVVFVSNHFHPELERRGGILWGTLARKLEEKALWDLHHGVDPLLDPFRTEHGGETSTDYAPLPSSDRQQLTSEAVVHFKKTNRARAQKLLGLKQGGGETILFVWAGRYEPRQKGFRIVLQTAPDLMSRDSRMQFAFLGWPNDLLEPDRQVLRRLKARYQDRVYFNETSGASRELVANVFAGGDFLMMPSNFEPFGLSNLEAMQMLCIPIVNAVGGIRATAVDPDRFTSEDKASAGQTVICIRSYDYDAYRSALRDDTGPYGLPKQQRLADRRRWFGFFRRPPPPREAARSAIEEKAADRFIEAMNRALALDDKARARIAINALRLVEKDHRWSEVVRRYYEPAISRGHQILRNYHAHYFLKQRERDTAASMLPSLLTDADAVSAELAFGDGDLVRHIASLCLRRDHAIPFLLLLNAEPGRGKSTCLRRLREILETEGSNRFLLRERGFRQVRVVSVDAWQCSTRAELQIALVAALDAQLKGGQVEAIGAIDAKIAAGAGALTGVPNAADTSGPLHPWSAREFGVLLSRKRNTLLRHLSSSPAAQIDGGCVVVLLDDLDRCPRVRLPGLVEDLAPVLETPGYCFVLGADLAGIAGRGRDEEEAMKELEARAVLRVDLPVVTERAMRQHVSELLGELLSEVGSEIVTILARTAR